mmetsp:Transcript_9691/g.18470  ORF Transcript_9691/g.18470 Transcript_9691/m.18470 type:complete len:236 (-) Transcript_9691:10-717(-)
MLLNARRVLEKSSLTSVPPHYRRKCLDKLPSFSVRFVRFASDLRFALEHRDDASRKGDFSHIFPVLILVREAEDGTRATRVQNLNPRGSTFFVAGEKDFAVLAVIELYCTQPSSSDFNHALLAIVDAQILVALGELDLDVFTPANFDGHKFAFALFQVPEMCTGDIQNDLKSAPEAIFESDAVFRVADFHIHLFVFILLFPARNNFWEVLDHPRSAHPLDRTHGTSLSLFLSSIK